MLGLESANRYCSVLGPKKMEPFLSFIRKLRKDLANPVNPVEQLSSRIYRRERMGGDDGASKMMGKTKSRVRDRRTAGSFLFTGQA